MQIVENRAASGSFTAQCYHSNSIRMFRSRLPDASARARDSAPPALPPGAGHAISPRQLLLHSWAGRLFIVATGLKLFIAALRWVGDLPAFVQIVNSAATVGLAISVGGFLWR